jgi:SAM-dependent methyltransferase
MYKKSFFGYLEKKYNTHLYTGLLGFFMKLGHKNLENFNNDIKISKVLEIGAGSHPHYDFIKHNFNEYHIAETSDYAINSYKDNKKFIVKKYDGKNLPYKNNTFDRIIISHCLEHILNPELFLIEMMSKLKRGGLLSISLPTDPGLLWRFGRFLIKVFILPRTYKISSEDFYYMNATEHVNSIFNLIAILRFNFKDKLEEHFWPLKIKCVDINLFYNVHVYKK